MNLGIYRTKDSVSYGFMSMKDFSSFMVRNGESVYALGRPVVVSSKNTDPVVYYQFGLYLRSVLKILTNRGV